jgi:hypothetical protein
MNCTRKKFTQYDYLKSCAKVAIRDNQSAADFIKVFVLIVQPLAMKAYQEIENSLKS